MQIFNTLLNLYNEIFLCHIMHHVNFTHPQCACGYGVGKCMTLACLNNILHTRNWHTTSVHAVTTCSKFRCKKVSICIGLQALLLFVVSLDQGFSTGGISDGFSKNCRNSIFWRLHLCETDHEDPTQPMCLPPTRKWHI